MPTPPPPPPRVPTSVTAVLIVAGAASMAAHAIDLPYFYNAVRLTLFHSNARKDLTVARLLRWTVSSSSVGTRDVDIMGHMNNARYSWKGDFGRFRLILGTGLYHAAQQLGAGFVLGSITQRFRRELPRGTAFNMYVRIIGWDTRAFYVEHVFVKKKQDTPSSRAVLSRHGNGALDAPTHATGEDEEPVASVEALRRQIQLTGSRLASEDQLEVASVLIGQMVLVPTTTTTHAPDGRRAQPPTPAEVIAAAGCAGMPAVLQPPPDVMQWCASVRDASARVIPPRPPASKL